MFCRIMNDVHNRTVVCCYRGKVGTDMSVCVCGMLICFCVTCASCWDFCIRILLLLCTDPYILKLRIKLVEYVQNFVGLEHNKALSSSKLSVFPHKLLPPSSGYNYRFQRHNL
jgi:hypothetical protein